MQLFYFNMDKLQAVKILPGCA